jgi:hypothetical protein
MQKNRNVRPLPGARAEIRHARKKLRRAAQDARAQDQSVQNAQAPSFLQTFGWRN